MFSQDTEPWRPRRYYTCLALILLVGFVLRALGAHWGQAYCHYAFGDEVEAYAAAVSFAHGGAAMHLGQPHCGAQGRLPGPLWTLFWLAALRLGGSPEMVAWAMLLLNTLVIYLVSVLGRRLFGPAHGLMAALYIATLPWMVFYSVGAYNPEVMAFFGVTIYLALWEAARREASPHVFWVPFLSLCALQFHASALLIALSATVVLVIMPTRVNKRWLVAGLAAAVLVFLPYLIGEMRSNWSNTQAMLVNRNSYSAGGLKTVHITLSQFMPWGAVDWVKATGGDFWRFGDAYFGSAFFLVALCVLSSACALGFVAHFFQHVREALRAAWRTPREAFRRAPATVFITLLLLVPLAVYFLRGQNYAGRYGIVLFPLLVMLPAMFLAGPLPRLRGASFLRRAAVLVVGFHVFLMAAVFRWQGEVIQHDPVFWASFRHLDELYRALKLHSGPNSRLVLTYSNGFADREMREAARPICMYVNVRDNDVSKQLAADARTTCTYELRWARDPTNRAAASFCFQSLAFVPRPNARDSRRGATPPGEFTPGL